MKKIILVSLLILTIMISSGCIEQEIDGTYEVDYYGTELLFNSNLDVAQNITVIPDEATLRNVLFGYEVAELQFAYFDNDTEKTYLYTVFGKKYFADYDLHCLEWAGLILD